SVSTASPRSSCASCPSSFSIARIGTASWITSAPWQALARSLSQRSTTPCCTASWQDCASRSTPTTSKNSPRSRSPLAKEPPMSPRPITTRRPNSGGPDCREESIARESDTLQHLAQRLQEARILGLGADGNTQEIRQPITSQRPDDHALVQQRLVDRCRI